MINNNIDIKQKNIASLIRTLRYSSPLLKKDLVNLTGLSFATVSSLCNRLIEQDVLDSSENSDMELSIGRNPKYISLKYNEYFIFYFDCHQRHEIIVGLMNLHSEVLDKVVLLLDSVDSFESFISLCYDYYKKLIKINKIDENKIIGVGCIIPGIHDKVTGIIMDCALDLLLHSSFQSTLQAKLEKPVLIDNEANLCAIGVQRHISHKNKFYNNIVYLYIDEGLGVGIISEGRILYGENGYGSEISHIPIGNPALKCRDCGSVGCVETDLCISGFLTKYHKREINFNKVDNMDDWLNFVDLAKNTDEALQVIEENGKILGILISILVNLLDPGIVVIGGIVSSLYEEMKPFVELEFKKRANITPNIYNIHITVDVDNDSHMRDGIADMLFEDWIKTI